MLSRATSRVTALPAWRAASTRWFCCAVPATASAEFERAKASLEGLSKRPDQATMLKLYALYKQIQLGPNTTPKPGMMDFVGKAKWTAWSELGDISQEEAETQYISVCRELGADVDGTGITDEAASGASAPAEAGEYSTILVSRSGSGVTTITMNRPEKKNAISMDMYLEIQMAMAAAAADSTSRAVVLTGQGDWYSSGNDLSNFTENMPPEGPTKMAADARALLEGYVASFIDFPLPLVAAVNGPAVGIPVTTLALCDFVYASHTTTMQTPFTKLGQSPEACSSVLFPQIMGQARANDVLLAGRKFTAAEACEWGLVNEVFEAGSFRASVEARVEAMAALPPISMRLSKELIGQTRRDTLHAVNKAECDLLQERWISDECMGAIMDFMSRRK